MIYKNVSIAAFGLLAGIALYVLTAIPLLYALLAFCLMLPVCAYVVYRDLKWKELPLIISFMSLFILGMSAGYMRLHYSMLPSQTDLLSYFNTESRQIRVEGVVVSDPVLRTNVETELLLSVNKVFDHKIDAWIKVKPVTVLVKIDKTDMIVSSFFDTLSDTEISGMSLQIAAVFIWAESPLNPGEFDYLNYMQRNNISAFLGCGSSDVRFVGRDNYWSFKKVASILKESFIQTFRRTIPSPESRLVSSVLLGTRRSLDKPEYNGRKIQDIFTYSGATTFINSSGLHIVILSLLLFTLFFALGFKTEHLAPGIITILLIFTLLTGARPSTLQAFMVTAIAIAVFSYLDYNIRKSAIIGLSVTAIALLLYNPFYLFTFSFMLTFGSVFILVAVAPPVMRWLNMLHGFTLIFFTMYYCLLVYLLNTDVQFFIQQDYLILVFGLAWIIIRISRLLNNRFPVMWNISFSSFPVPVKALFAFFLAFQIGIQIPLSAWYTGLFPTSSLITLVVTIPVIGMILILGTITGVVGLIPFIGQWVALPFGASTYLFSRILLIIADTGSTVLQSPILPKPDLLWLAGYFLLLFILLYSFLALPYIKAVFFRINNRLNTIIIRALPVFAGAAIIVIPILINVTRSEKELTMILFHAEKRSFVSIVTEKGIAGLVIPPAESLDTNAVSTGLRSEQGTTISTIFTSQFNSQLVLNIQTLEKIGFKPSLLLLPKHLSENNENKSHVENRISTSYVAFYNFSPMTKMSFAPRGSEEKFMNLQIFDHKIMLVHTLEADEMSDDITLLASAELSDLSLLVLPEIESAEELQTARMLINGTNAPYLVITNGQSGYSRALLKDSSVQEMDVYVTSQSGALFCSISENSLKIDTLLSIRKRKEVIIRSFLQ